MDKIVFPGHYKEETTGYNNPKFIRNDGLVIDIVFLKNINSIIRRGLPATKDKAESLGFKSVFP